MAYIDNITFDLLCGHSDYKYAGNLGHRRGYCNYLEIVGHKRPCKPTPDCNCYEKGELQHIVKHISITRE